MYVKTLSKGRGVTGLHVGSSNARRYFSEDNLIVELELEHLNIRCELKPEFWLGEPHIHDPRLGSWLESKHLHGKTDRKPVPLSLIPCGKNRFRLTAVQRNGADRPNQLAAVVEMPSPDLLSPNLPILAVSYLAAPSLAVPSLNMPTLAMPSLVTPNLLLPSLVESSLVEKKTAQPELINLERYEYLRVGTTA